MYCAWHTAKAPNYEVNQNKHYAYSELPYLGECQLVKIPDNGKLIDHVDYWGEGRIENSQGVSGFKDSFNVNHQFQLVSRGADKGKKIPNRVPTEDFENCDTSRYIEDSTVKVVTVTAGKLNSSCINDIYRTISCDDGFVVVYYNNEDNIKEIANLERALQRKGIYEVPGYSLTGKFTEITFYCRSKVFLSVSNLSEKLLEHVNKGDYYTSVRLLRELDLANQSALIKALIDRLLIEANPHMTDLAYLTYTTSTELFEKYFAHIYKSIFSSAEVKLVGSHYNRSVKLDVNVDEYNDRLVWGTASNGEPDRLNWKFIPVYENNTVSFRLKNVKHDMYIKLDVNTIANGDRKAWGATLTREERFLWKIKAVKVNDKIVFLIINKTYNQGLKMADSVDSYNDRMVLSSHEPVDKDPLKYGWIVPYWSQ